MNSESSPDPGDTSLLRAAGCFSVRVDSTYGMNVGISTPVGVFPPQVSQENKTKRGPYVYQA
jgi:hypothetical protein